MFANEEKKTFRRAERVIGDVKNANAQRGWYGHADTFVRHISQNGREEPAFTNIGRWKHDSAAEKAAPVYIPWITVDIDNVDIVEAYEDAKRTVDRLLNLGYQEDRIVCSFSGSKGFHIQVDSTQMGLVPFVGQTAARVFLRNFSDDVCMDDYYDPSVCSPRSLIRITGSTHEKTGLRKRSFLAEEFMGRGLNGVMKNVRGDYRPFEWPEGGSILPGPRKHLRKLYEPSENQYRAIRHRGGSTGRGNGKIINTIKYGIEEGQEFGPKNFHVGRENAAFLMGCKLIGTYSDNLRKAKRKLTEWNGLNDPPLPVQRLRAQWRGAKRKMSDKVNIRDGRC